MKRWLLILSVAAASLLATSAAFAGTVSGLNLAWANCLGDGGTSNLNFACNSNSGSVVLVASYLPSASLTQMTGNETVIDFLTTSSTSAALTTGWWGMKAASSCRPTALSVNFAAPGTAVNCVDTWSGQASGGIGAYTQTTSTGWSISAGDEPNHYRLTIAAAIPTPGVIAVNTGSEYFSANISISKTKSTGTGSCVGCSDPVCIVLNQIKLTQPVGVGDQYLSAASAAGSNVATWQGGVGGGCSAVPTRNTTWGAIKSLYR